jgi:hypothetical protein
MATKRPADPQAHADAPAAKYAADAVYGAGVVAGWVEADSPLGQSLKASLIASAEALCAFAQTKDNDTSAQAAATWQQLVEANQTALHAALGHAPKKSAEPSAAAVKPQSRTSDDDATAAPGAGKEESQSHITISSDSSSSSSDDEDDDDDDDSSPFSPNKVSDIFEQAARKRRPTSAKAGKPVTMESLNMKVEEMPLKGGKPHTINSSISPEKFERMRKLIALSMNPGTEAEGENAARILESELRKYNVSRTDILTSIVENTDASYLAAAGRYLLIIPMVKMPDWLWDIAGGVAKMFKVQTYRSRSKKVVEFIFYGPADAANSAAHLCGEVICAVKELTGNYVPTDAAYVHLLTARTSYARGLASGYRTLAEQLNHERDVLDAEERAKLMALTVYDEKVLAAASKAVKDEHGRMQKKTRTVVVNHAASFACGKADANKLSTGKKIQ